MKIEPGCVIYYNYIVSLWYQEKTKTKEESGCYILSPFKERLLKISKNEDVVYSGEIRTTRLSENGFQSLKRNGIDIENDFNWYFATNILFDYIVSKPIEEIEEEERKKETRRIMCRANAHSRREVDPSGEIWG